MQRKKIEEKEQKKKKKRKIPNQQKLKFNINTDHLQKAKWNKWQKTLLIGSSLSGCKRWEAKKLWKTLKYLLPSNITCKVTYCGIGKDKNEFEH